MSNYRKRIPYGMMNFVDVRKDNCYFVDKTRFIPTMEQANKFFFFIRPRRFGKSLTMSMLQHYYDVLDKDKFDELYGDLYIGKHPTDERNSYLIINLDFSIIDGTLGNYKSSLDEICYTEFCIFCDKYASFLPEGIKLEMKQKEGAVSQLNYLIKECDKVGQGIYLFIDEYDHFTNDILSDAGRLKDYESETHGEGYLRKFFNTIKAGTSSALKRCFVTGVSPVTMDDLTSGFNIGTNYSTSPEFNELVGFTEEDVREMLDYYRTTVEFHHSTDELIEKMKPWYDNYCFAKQCYGRTTMYNSNMVLYFVDNYIRRGCEIPDNMIYQEFHSDNYAIKNYIIKMQEYPHVKRCLQTLQEKGCLNEDIYNCFRFEDFKNPYYFVSTLYNWGLLTQNGQCRGSLILTIPNKIAKELLFNDL